MKNETNTRQAGAKTAKEPRIKDENSADSGRVRFAFVPIVREFRAHTQKNQARLWIPVETSLLVRYEFASCSLQTRYIFVAVVLFCGANGIEEIPLDAKFMSSVLVADERTIQKSFDELISKKLLVERKERETERTQTERQETAGAGVSVEFENLSKTEDENQSGLLKIVPLHATSNGANGNSKHSGFTIEECLRYVEVCQSKGDAIQNPKALASHLFKTGTADAFITATLYPAKQEELMREQFGAPVSFSDEPCRICFGAKMADADGKGFRKCEHCRDERGKSTGFEPEGETGDVEK